MPQVETVINKPLGGNEVRRIILNKLETAMAGDCRLQEFLAFPAFQFKLDLAIVLAGAAEPHDKLNYEVAGSGGDIKVLTDDPGQESHVVTVHVEDYPKPPNEARVEAGLGVPVLTRDERGREVEREIQFQKKVTRKA